MNASIALRRRGSLLLLAVVAALLLVPGVALAQTMPQGSSYDCDGDGAGTTMCNDTIADTFQSSVSDFGTLVVDLAPFLFAGLITVLLIRLAMKWFRRVAKSV